MNLPPEPIDPSIAAAEGKLARLGVQVDTMQAVLVRLLQDVVDAETRLQDTHAAQLVEANEQLVLAALASQTEAETAAQALTEVAQSSELDALTRLPNRTMLRDRFVQAVAQCRRQGTHLALLFLDLDGFKQLNDTHGHAFGDQVLQRVAGLLVAAVREVDTVSRHGGDEFLILLADLNKPGDAQAVAEKLIAAIGAPAEWGGKAVGLSASVGIAVYPDDGADVDTLIARADAAMYQTKRQRAGGIAMHGSGLIEAPGQPGVPKPVRGAQRAGDASDPERRLVELREANERLVLAALSAQELQAAAQMAQLRQATFLAAVADELGNPRAPIRIAAEMLGRRPEELPLLPRVKQLVEQQIDRMSRLVDHLVKASDGAPGGLEFDRRRVDLAEVIDAAVAAYRPLLDRHRQRFEMQRPEGALEVLGDAARLEQIVANLLDNACTHTPDGGRIRLAVGVDADRLTLTVSDDGVGISPQLLPYVFEPFVLDALALDFSGVGLGIGLTVVRALVRAHGGDIAAHSAGTRRGSQFVVTLPLASAPAPASPDVPAAAASATGLANPRP